MKTFRRSFTTQGYSLIELLIVIGIIAILSGLAVPGIIAAMRKAKHVKTHTVLTGLVTGLNHYRAEYNRFPLPPGQTGGQPIPLSEGSPVLKILLGENDQRLNPREMRYIEAPVGTGGANGLTGTAGSYALMDPWGSPYEVMMDASGAEKLPNPDAKNSDPAIASGAAPWLFVTAAARSLGEDKKADTKDDVVSWRP